MKKSGMKLVTRPYSQQQHAAAPDPDVSCPVVLHQETVPFLYESFETALAEKFPEIGVEMLTVFGAVMSGSRHNALRAISPATSKMLLKTVQRAGRGEGCNQELHISAIYASAKSLQVWLQFHSFGNIDTGSEFHNLTADVAAIIFSMLQLKVLTSQPGAS